MSKNNGLGKHVPIIPKRMTKRQRTRLLTKLGRVLVKDDRDNTLKGVEQ